MDWIIFFFGSGAAFFAGVGMVVAAALFHGFYPRKWLEQTLIFAGFIGLAFIILSATPLDYWFYAGSCATTLFWFWSERSKLPRAQKLRKPLRYAVIIAWSIGALFEVPHTFRSNLNVSTGSRLYIFADSVTAGLGEAGLRTWPQLLASARGIEVVDYSQAGATVSSALRKAKELSVGDGTILLEIGGNDVLGRTSSTDFAKDLDRLLALLSRPDRPILMFELPLPPFGNEFGRAQRRLAEKYGVHLIPKWVFIKVLTTDGATVDSVHLTQQGQALMAAAVGDVIEPVSNFPNAQ